MAMTPYPIGLFSQKRLKAISNCHYIYTNKGNREGGSGCTPPSPMGYIVQKANVMKRCPKVKQNMRINMVLMIFDNIVWFKRNLKK